VLMALRLWRGGVLEGQHIRETLENQADLRDNDHVIVGAHWGDGQ
jgi:hypothetical protein